MVWSEPDTDGAFLNECLRAIALSVDLHVSLLVRVEWHRQATRSVFGRGEHDRLEAIHRHHRLHGHRKIKLS